MSGNTTHSLDLSICIVGHQRCQMLADCLASIYQHVQELHFEVIVIDNASTDGTADMMRTRFPQVRLEVNQESHSFAENNNVMLRQAVGRYVLLLNDDTYLTHNAFKVMVDFFDAHPEAGAVGCRDIKGLPQRFGKIIYILDLIAVFGDWYGDSDNIRFLKGISPQQIGADLSG